MEEVIPSRVSKITLYNLFQQVCKKYGQHDLASLDYLKAKRAATTFQRMKSFVGKSGHWKTQDSCMGPFVDISGHYYIVICDHLLTTFVNEVYEWPFILSYNVQYTDICNMICVH